ncbi:hypothetical protein PYW07_015460 [Mythimna separata]|uniref:Uncharacterized protein n=1 Tax=Mythimna separata TaxID=271217 RepID=A0AAD7YZL5_MYTSE|nr:hypothetical protein PYW07_015460 [Mythimna separata]
MFGKIFLSICFMGISQAVFIDQSDNHYKGYNKESPHAWQMVKVYHPPNPQPFGYKYESFAYPKYEFEYAVSDDKTGDHKHHHEARDGDRVRGEYSLVESDGSLRKVQYQADDHSGFNAVVSKTMNKHGNNAISVTDQTRFFYPVSNGIKINHYFPGKSYQYQSLQHPENNNDSRPVHEEKEVAAVEEPKMLVIDAGDKVMLVEQEQAKEVTPSSKPEVVQTVQVVPALVSVIPPSPENDKINNEMPLSNVEKAEVLLANDSSSTPEEVAVEKALEKEDQKQSVEKEDQNSQDSEVASSYYHSRFYYVGF